MGEKRLKIVSCRVMSREIRLCAARSTNRIDIEFVHQGLHEFPGKLAATLSDRLAAVESEDYDAVLLNYGLCGNGALGLSHPELPIVVHNVHDCIPLLLGDRGRQAEYVARRPGTFWYSCGWIEGFPLPGGPDYAEKYGSFYGKVLDGRMRDVVERMLMENYTHLVFVRWDELGEKVVRHGRGYTAECVRSLGLRLGREFRYDEVKGGPALLQRFVDGVWDGDDTVIIEPGKRLVFDALQNRLAAV
jgi:hypothetical protein